MKTGPGVSISDGLKRLGFILALAILLVTAAYYFLFYKSDSWVGIRQKNDISTETLERRKPLRQAAEQEAQNIALFQAVTSKETHYLKTCLGEPLEVMIEFFALILMLLDLLKDQF